jgi:hypothetical protein
MKTFFFTAVVVLALFSVPMSAGTVDFNAYGATTGLAPGTAEVLGTNSLAFPGFTLSANSGELQLDAPGYYGAVNYELLADDSNLTIIFNSAQSSFLD